MAIAIENASIGTPIKLGTSASTIAYTTNATVASGSTIAVVMGYVGVTVNSVSDNSGNGYTWTIDKKQANGSPEVAIASLYASSGLASGTVITANLSASSNVRQMAGISWIGGATSSILDQSNSRIDFGAATWSTGSITPVVSDSIVLGAFVDFGNGSSQTSAPDSGWTEWLDQFDSDMTLTSVYNIVADTTARNPSGAFTGNTGGGDQAGVTANYKAAAGGGTNITIQPGASIITASIVSPPLPRPVNPFSEVNLRM